MRIINHLISKILGIYLIKTKSLNQLFSNISNLELQLKILTFFVSEFGAQTDFFRLKVMSKSDHLQDLIVINSLKFKSKGYFVEIGAGDGITGSNTYLLQNNFGWNGILVEPANYFHNDLNQNRPGVKISNDVIWSESGIILDFNNTTIPTLSTINQFMTVDKNKYKRKTSSIESKISISLNDLLMKYGAPTHIDYISIDTEGSEFEILKAFDFKRFKINTFSIEHNYNIYRNQIYHLMVSNGYVRKYENITGIDDFYVLNT
jgi:FkbM family methyltransferase